MKGRATKKSTRLAITLVWFSVMLVAPTGYLSRQVPIKYEKTITESHRFNR
jgi:hypothetical protein